MLFIKGEYYLILNIYENEKLEVFWTIIPAIILIILGIPSLKLLYSIEGNYYSLFSVKIIGRQWYWRYDYRGFKKVFFDSFIKPFNTLKLGDFRLLETDNNVVLPFNTNIMLIISSRDVIHRWAVPTLNTKMDANPGRLNVVYLKSTYPGLYYGQCSEICGANHSFIPICV